MNGSETRSGARIPAGAGLRRLVPGVLALILVWGCDSTARTASSPDSLVPWEAVPDLVIGSVDGDVMFGAVGEVRKGPDGNVYVVEFNPTGVRVFGPDGTPAGSIGREGEGPGEYLAASGVGWWGDTLWVWDSRLRRLSRFDPAGTFLGSLQPEPLELPGDGPGFNPSRPLSEGSFLYTQSLPAQLIGSGVITRTPVLRATADGEVLDTLYVRELTNGTLHVANGIYWFTGQPFSDLPFQVVQAEEETVVLVDWQWGADPAVILTRRTFDGDTLYRTRMSIDPAPVTSGQVDEQVRLLAERLRTGALSSVPEGEARSLIRGQLYVPDFHRRVWAVHSGADGSAWLRMRPPDPETAEDEPSLWIVVDREGSPIRTVEFPPRFTPRHLGEHEVWGVLRDELGVNYVARLVLRETG